MKTYLSFLTLIFCSIHFVLGQDLPNIVPPSPNAASLAQYVQVPVSHYTGLPNISVPLYNVSSGDIQVPINLSYHARGIKVEEIASNYGLGWSMNAGGVITRQIRGRADDQINGYLGQSHYDGFFNSASVRSGANTADTNGLFDRDPDLFMFNFLGFSGKFIYDRDTNEPILQTFDDLKIETFGDDPTDPADITGGIENFLLTDSKGIKYYFGKSSNGSAIARDSDHTEINYTYSYSGLTLANATPSGKFTSWYLMEIINPLGKTVTFTYESEQGGVDYSTTHRKSEEIYDKDPGVPGTKIAYFSKVRIYQKKIKKIEFESGEVNFDYSFIREDLDNSTALSSVEVLNKHNQRINKYVFDYFHSQSNDGYSNMIYHLYQNEPEARKRLFLNSIKQEGNPNQFLPPHKFTYNSTNILPNRFSTSHDMWGYYNGKHNGEFSVFSENPSEIASRAIDTINSQAGMLTKIEYPTGGFSTYTYESNRAIFPPHLTDHIALGPSNPIEQKGVSIEKDPTLYDSSTATYSIPFTVGPNLVVSNINSTSGTVLTSVQIDSQLCTDVENSNCPYKFRIYNTNGTVQSILHKTSITTIIDPGNYVLKVESNFPSTENPNDFENSFGVVLQWQESVDNQDDLIYTGGNRIKNITLDDGNGQTIVKNYEYKDDTGKTSGKVFALPRYFEFSELVINGGKVVRLLHAIVGKPANNLTYEQGNHGGYSFVTEYYGDKNNNHGKTEYEFTAFYDSGLFYKWPYFLPTDNEWMRGKLLEQRNFRNNNGSYEIITKTKNTYAYAGVINGWAEIANIEYDAKGDILPNSKTRNLVKLAAWNGIYDPNWSISNRHNLYTPYYLNAGSLKLKKTETMSYYNLETVNNITEYFYNYDDHYQVKHTQNTKSDGESNYSEIIYPQDKPTLTSAEQELKDQHQFVPLEVNNFEGIITNTSQGYNVLPSFTLSKQKTNFSEPIYNVILPSNIQASKGSNALQNKIEFLSYYSNGKIKEVSKTNGTPIVYIWGYNETLPIAKIENATFSEIPTSIYNAILSASNADSNTTTENTLRIELEKLRNASYCPNLTDSMVTTYTYDPLIGATSVTDSKGYTMYYEYDEFNRLKRVKDTDGKIMSENEYYYVNPSQP